MKLTFMLMLISCVISQLAATCLRNRRPVPIFRWIKKTMRNTDLTIPEPDPVVKLLEPNGFSVSIKAHDGLITDVYVAGDLNDEPKLSPNRPYNGSIGGWAEKKGDNFVFLDRDINFKVGDVCTYHVLAIRKYCVSSLWSFSHRFRVTLSDSCSLTVFQDRDQHSGSMPESKYMYRISNEVS